MNSIPAKKIDKIRKKIAPARSSEPHFVLSEKLDSEQGRRETFKYGVGRTKASQFKLFLRGFRFYDRPHH